MTLTLDSDRIVGASVVGGSSVTIHAIITLVTDPKELRLYCRPRTAATAVDFPKGQSVTCELCKAKLKRELTVA